MQTELRLRIVSGIVLAAVVLAATWAGDTVFRAVAVVIGLLVFFEWSTICGLAIKDRAGNSIAWLALILVSFFVMTLQGAGALLVIALAAAYGLAERPLGRETGGWLGWGVVYAGLSSVSLSAIRGDDLTGLMAMIFVFAVVWGTDILAYFVGRAVGGPKLAPRISPGKTWSGAIGGAVSAVILGTAVYMAYFTLDTVWIPLIALVLSVFSQIGDLFESFVKRRFGVKDSGNLIPGHGGVMDRVDGLVFACFAAFLIGIGAALVSGRSWGSAGGFVLGF
ncbi:phosphatidate cytidylyltransferase [Rhizobium sp. TRM95111]|uniref:phosphatidate cytidylyltransferase n=1 Tax=Rhizobium alarense TaxID=2846851 RepID=UPI001F2E85BE|nr:phosphatidate cytidylyltransferase [Rhizobium alarense]MCF3639079.1 phosphatidate cytidylyltransferase [Rhizobium alarense]